MHRKIEPLLNQYYESVDNEILVITGARQRGNLKRAYFRTMDLINVCNLLFEISCNMWYNLLKGDVTCFII